MLQLYDMNNSTITENGIMQFTVFEIMPTRCLMKEERIEVHHNYISAVSNLEHKKVLINRLKWSEP